MHSRDLIKIGFSHKAILKRLILVLLSRFLEGFRQIEELNLLEIVNTINDKWYVS